jgi:hypothetical protein
VLVDERIGQLIVDVVDRDGEWLEIGKTVGEEKRKERRKERTYLWV